MWTRSSRSFGLIKKENQSAILGEKAFGLPYQQYANAVKQNEKNEQMDPKNHELVSLSKKMSPKQVLVCAYLCKYEEYSEKCKIYDKTIKKCG